MHPYHWSIRNNSVALAISSSTWRSGRLSLGIRIGLRLVSLYYFVQGRTFSFWLIIGPDGEEGSSKGRLVDCSADGEADILSKVQSGFTYARRRSVKRIAFFFSFLSLFCLN